MVQIESRQAGDVRKEEGECERLGNGSCAAISRHNRVTESASARGASPESLIFVPSLRLPTRQQRPRRTRVRVPPETTHLLLVREALLERFRRRFAHVAVVDRAVARAGAQDAVVPGERADAVRVRLHVGAHPREGGRVVDVQLPFEGADCKSGALQVKEEEKTQ